MDGRGKDTINISLLERKREKKSRAQKITEARRVGGAALE